MDKLTIKNLDNNVEFTVLFNPTEYTVEDASSWTEQRKSRRRGELQYTGGQRKTLTMELFFDTYEERNPALRDVRKHTGKIADLLVPSINQSNQGKRPPKVQLSWGQQDPNSESRIMPMAYVLEKLTQKFVLFDNSGTPVRATLNVTFKEFILPRDEERRSPRRHSFPRETFTVKSGDTVSSIAATLWNDPSRWRIIAENNEIDNPRILKPGRTLVIPTIQ